MNKISTYKYLFISFAFLLFHTSLLYGQNMINANQGYVEQQKYLTTVSYEDIKGKIIIDVVINNKNRKFILDTGAVTVISENLYNELTPKSLGQMGIIDQSGLEDTLNVVSMSEIKFGELSFKDIPAVVSKESKIFFECFGVDGFIGSNLLRNSVVQFNSKDKTISFSDNPKSLKLKKKYSNDMELSAIQSNPFVWIKLQKGKSFAKEKVLFDTGADGLYTMSIFAYNHIISEKLNIFETLAESEGTFSVGLHGTANKSLNYALNIPTLEVNNFKLNNITTKTTSGQTSLFGSEILNYGKITLDYINKKFYLEPFDNVSEFNIEERIWTIEPILENEKIIIGTVWDKTLNEKINVGDEILKFDTIDYQNLDFCEIVRSNNKSDKTKALLVLKDVKTGEIKNVEIQKLR